MNRRILGPLCAAVVMVACDNPSPTELPGLIAGPKRGPAFLVTTYMGSDPGTRPGDEFPNSNAAAASFDAAAGALAPLKYETFEGAAVGPFTTLQLTDMTVTLTNAHSTSGIKNTFVTFEPQGFNTTDDGSKHLNIIPVLVQPTTVTVTFTPSSPLQAWGAYFTDVEAFDNTLVELVFDDGTEQAFQVPRSEGGGAAFFGFTDPGKFITSVTVRETVTPEGPYDFFSIDDIRYAPAGGTQQEVPANEPATVTVEENGNAVAAIDIAANTFNEDVTVTVRFEELAPSEICHGFLLAQVGRCLEVTAKNAANQNAQLQQAVTIGLCLPPQYQTEATPVELFKFDDRFGAAVPLQQAETPFLDCSNFSLASVKPRNEVERLAFAVMKRVGKWVSPKLLYAADRGFGGFADDLSFFTWATPIQIQRAALAINPRSRGKDLFTVHGTFDLSPKPFAPGLDEAGFSLDLESAAPTAAYDVKVIYGKGLHGSTGEFVVSKTAFKYSRILKRFVYAAKIGDGNGISLMSIDPLTGQFSVAGATPTEGGAPQAFRAFTLQIGQRTQGGGLYCGEAGRYKCELEH